MLLWGALGALLAVAMHGLRDRIRRSQQAAARLQERVGPPTPSANGNGSTRDFAPLREQAREDGIAIEVGPVAVVPSGGLLGDPGRA